jgi:hypothetical protein
VDGQVREGVSVWLWVWGLCKESGGWGGGGLVGLGCPDHQKRSKTEKKQGPFLSLSISP